MQISRDTRGTYFSLRNSKKRAAEAAAAGGGQVNPLQWILQHQGDGDQQHEGVSRYLESNRVVFY